MKRGDAGARGGRRPLPGPSAARFSIPYLAAGIVLMAAAFALARVAAPHLGAGLAPYAPAISIALVFGGGFLLFRLVEARRAAAETTRRGLPLAAFVEAGGVIGPNLDEAARSRTLAALRSLARRTDVRAIEIEPEAVDGGAADSVMILTTAPAHLIEPWEARLGAEFVGPAASAPGGARRLRFVWD